MNTVQFELTSHSREQVRQEVITKWLTEYPGLPDKPRKYRYNVERLSDKTWIYLLRPAGLNKGCDFVIECEGFLKFKNGKDRPPRHDDIKKEIDKLVKQYPNATKAMLEAISNIWDCQSPAIVIAGLPSDVQGSLELERVLKLLRWMFIEQDVTYWTHSGRWMLRNALEADYGPLVTV